MKTFLFLFIFFTLSYAQRLDILDLPVIDLTSINTANSNNDRDHDHVAVPTMADLVTKEENVISDSTTSKLSKMIDNNKPKVSRFDLHYFGKNKRSVRLSNRFPFPRTGSQLFPRRCDHNEPDQRFVIPGGEMNQNMVQFMFKKDETMKNEMEKGNKEIKKKKKHKKRVMRHGRLMPRHTARRDVAKMNMTMHNRPHLHFGQTIRYRSHQRDDHRKEQMVFKRGKENIKSDNQKISERHDEHGDGIKRRGQEVLYKIRKFLNYL